MSSTGRTAGPGEGEHPRDLYQTPDAALMPLLLSGAVDLTGPIWEACAGRGAMVRCVIAAGVHPSQIVASDIEIDAAYFPMPVAVAAHDLAARRFETRARVMLTNPPYRVPDTGAPFGLTDAQADRFIPKARRRKGDPADSAWRDGVALAFEAGRQAGMRQIVIGPIRIAWWTGATRTRGEARARIRSRYDVRLHTLGWRPRFLDAAGGPAGAGVDSCEYCYVIATRRPAWQAYPAPVEMVEI